MTQPKGTPRWEFIAKCTSIAGGNSTLVPVANDAEVATSIVINGNDQLVVNDEYLIHVRRR